MTQQRQTHARRPMPAHYAKSDWTMPRITPIVGDTIVYETWSGDKIHRDDARKLMLEGKTVYYTTWEVVD